MENKIALLNGVENPTQLDLATLIQIAKDDRIEFRGKEDFLEEVKGIPADTVFKFIGDWVDNTLDEYVRHYEYRYPNPKARNPADSDIVLNVYLWQAEGENGTSIGFQGEEQWG